MKVGGKEVWKKPDENHVVGWAHQDGEQIM